MFLRRIADVTDEAMEMRDSMIREGKFGVFGTRKIYGAIEKKYGKDTPYEVSCASMWRGEKYLLFYYEVYKDVRLVGAPPEKIGAFGGNQDNWGWPQHKGDFALYRVYGDKDGKARPVFERQRSDQTGESPRHIDGRRPRRETIRWCWASRDVPTGTCRRSPSPKNSRSSTRS